MSFDLENFRHGKPYDLLMGLPLIGWFIYTLTNLRPVLRGDAVALLSQPANLLFNLTFYAHFASGAFACLNIYMIVTRTAPILRSRGLVPRLCAVAGTFLGVGINDLRPVSLPVSVLSVAFTLLLVGGVGSVIVLGKLGKSFSIMPEARKLVTTGPYAFARHPLYAAEMLSIAGTAILYQQPWATLLAVGVLVLLTIRSHFEEQVLREAYPEYAAYRARVKRFGFI